MLKEVIKNRTPYASCHVQSNTISSNLFTYTNNSLLSFNTFQFTLHVSCMHVRACKWKYTALNMRHAFLTIPSTLRCVPFFYHLFFIANAISTYSISICTFATWRFCISSSALHPTSKGWCFFSTTLALLLSQYNIIVFVPIFAFILSLSRYFYFFVFLVLPLSSQLDFEFFVRAQKWYCSIPFFIGIGIFLLHSNKSPYTPIFRFAYAFIWYSCLQLLHSLSTPPLSSTNIWPCYSLNFTEDLYHQVFFHVPPSVVCHPFDLLGIKLHGWWW